MTKTRAFLASLTFLAACMSAEEDASQEDLVEVESKSQAILEKTWFDCRVEHNNQGCAQSIYCPGNQGIVEATAGCNLESGSATPQFDQVPPGYIQVTRESDNHQDGSCKLGGIGFSGGNARTGARASLASLRGLNSVVATCREHDNNGGDCHIHGYLICAPFF